MPLRLFVVLYHVCLFGYGCRTLLLPFCSLLYFPVQRVLMILVILLGSPSFGALPIRLRSWEVFVFVCSVVRCLPVRFGGAAAAVLWFVLRFLRWFSCVSGCLVFGFVR